ncbi:hypothetical protein AB3K78_10720 [Leucobacter sp. HNU]|uniref:hypothetical protein n=1 Tax=Leucobacter sp. HNU TaxID=3236805 RepID=UPI003A7FBA65
MSPILLASLVAGATLLLSLLLPFVVRPLLIRLGIMDVPNERSSHSRPVLRGLGLAVLIAMLVGGCSECSCSATVVPPATAGTCCWSSWSLPSQRASSDWARISTE